MMLNIPFIAIFLAVEAQPQNPAILNVGAWTAQLEEASFFNGKRLNGRVCRINTPGIEIVTRRSELPLIGIFFRQSKETNHLSDLSHIDLMEIQTKDYRYLARYSMKHDNKDTALLIGDGNLELSSDGVIWKPVEKLVEDILKDPLMTLYFTDKSRKPNRIVQFDVDMHGGKEAFYWCKERLN